MIPELFLCAALALPAGQFHAGYGDTGDGGNQPGQFQKENFLREYKYLIELLKGMYPGHEFMIIPIRNPPRHSTPPGWTYVNFQWRRHIIYRRPAATPEIQAFFSESALALPVASIHFKDTGERIGIYELSNLNRDEFLREYERLHEYLEKNFPGQEFLIVPAIPGHPAPGDAWERIPFTWRDHLIYKRPVRRLLESAG